MKSVPCAIITPEKIYLRDEAEFVAAPAFEGEVGILPGHARFIARLVPGSIRIVKGQETRRFAVNAGFLAVEPDAVTILTPAVKPL